MRKDLEKVRDQVVLQIIKNEVFSYITRGTNLQKNSILELEKLKESITNKKSEFIKKSDDDGANTCLSLECLILSLSKEIDMLIKLKEDNPHSAWIALVDAQDYLRASIMAKDLNLNVDGRAHKLEITETYLFPPMMFTSPGFILKNVKCSICKENYSSDSCSHLEGRAYMGQFCSTVPEIETLDHVALVKDPANKRAFIANFSDNGKIRDKLTWELTEPKNKENSETN